MINRWQGAPRSVRTAALAVVVVLAYGTAVHVVHLVASGFNPYPDLPGWLRVYFTALTVSTLSLPCCSLGAAAAA